MGPLTLPVLDAQDIAWFRDAESLPAAARGAASALARRIGFDEQRCAEVALAVSEAGTNLRRHAVDGTLLLRVVRTADDAGVECVTIDSGPGMADVPHSLTDGVSSAGTLGIGLGAISRLADTIDIHSLPDRGTVLAARFWTKEAARRAAALGEPVVAGLTRPITGEETCGDVWAARAVGAPEQEAAAARRPARQPSAPDPLDWTALTGFRPSAGDARRTPDRTPRPAGAPDTDTDVEPALLLMFCDGLGHGPLAARAADAAAAAFRDGTARHPEGVIAEIHRALRGGRGGAVAVVRIEPQTRTVSFCGVGNVSTFVVDADAGTRRSLLSAPGIVGHQMPTLRTVRQELPRGSGVIMHSDGLTERWQPKNLPGLLAHSPLVAAALLLREAGIRRDDAGVAVAKGAW
ncbi:ATP-binding SpoIIE family protein phosphatase [uncultured Streptomyces sp.]|uniref:ATP-binding SpoIIE family protein phosphatase n=1 Tax=uncultured Streptomyces sp. TaxID=174707 RepID=UPI00261115C5|nr:ATP-binding SpoIIE family protein phosphatase [uncultured Streptomyces sp.]